MPLDTLPVRKLAPDVRPPSGNPFVVCSFEDEALLPMQIVPVKTGLVFAEGIQEIVEFKPFQLKDKQGILPVSTAFMDDQLVVMVTISGEDTMELAQREPFASIFVQRLRMWGDKRAHIRFAVQEPEGGRLMFGEGRKVENRDIQ